VQDDVEMSGFDDPGVKRLSLGEISSGGHRAKDGHGCVPLERGAAGAGHGDWAQGSREVLEEL
jgi:hypothetical protein